MIERIKPIAAAAKVKGFVKKVPPVPAKKIVPTPGFQDQLQQAKTEVVQGRGKYKQIGPGTFGVKEGSAKMTLQEFAKVAVTMKMRDYAMSAALSRLEKLPKLLRHVAGPANRAAAEAGIKQRTHSQLSNILGRLQGRHG